MKIIELMVLAGILTALLALESGCSKASFAGGQTIKARGGNAPTGSDVSASGAGGSGGPGTGGVLSLASIPDMKINTSILRYQAETLRFAIKVRGGSGAITLSLEKDNKQNSAAIEDGFFKWTPGYTDESGAMFDEAGIHEFKVMAEDASGAKAVETFSVEAVPISWGLVPDAQDSVRFFIRESLHPERRYKAKTSLNGQALQTKRCVSMYDGETTLTLKQEPVPHFQGITAVDGTLEHSFSIRYALQDKDAHLQDRAVFFTAISFSPEPAAVNNSTERAPDIFNYAVVGICSTPGGSGDLAKCASETAQKINAHDVYYCSDYSSHPELKKEMLKAFMCSQLGVHNPKKFGCDPV